MVLRVWLAQNKCAVFEFADRGAQLVFERKRSHRGEWYRPLAVKPRLPILDLELPVAVPLQPLDGSLHDEDPE